MYLMEHPGEGDRMERRDADEAEKHLDLAGIVNGEFILDAGCASGWLTRRIAHRTDPGHVIGIDKSFERLEQARALAQASGISNIEFVQGDLYDLPFDNGHFDRVFSRYTFEYLKHPETALAELCRVTRKGGHVVLADLDGNGLFHFPMPPMLAALQAKLSQTLGSLGFDPFIGRKLFHLCAKAGLKSLKVHALPHHLTAGEATLEELENWTIKLETIRPYLEPLFPSSSVYTQFMDECITHLRRPDTLTWSLTFLVIGVV